MIKTKLPSPIERISRLTKTPLIEIKQITLAPIRSREPTFNPRLNEINNGLSGKTLILHREKSARARNSIKLPSIISQTSTSTYKVPRTKEPIFVIKNNHEATKHKLPSISPKPPTKKILIHKQDPLAKLITKKDPIPVISENVNQTQSQSGNSTVRSQVHFVSPFRLIWLDANIIMLNEDHSDQINQLQEVVDRINFFTDSQLCTNFLQKKTDEKLFLIVSNILSQSMIPHIHGLSHLQNIFIFTEIIPKNKQWIKNWPKIKGIFLDIESIHQHLQQEIQRCRTESTAISNSSINLNRLDPSYMYTQLLKEILLHIENDHTAMKELIEFFRKSHFHMLDRKIIDEFEQDYYKHTPVWWYTRDCFIFDMINSALRSQDVSVIIHTRFFIRDLHTQIKQLYKLPTDTMILYRGQGLSYGDFQQLRTLVGGLYSFHQFLSTTDDRAVALLLAQSSGQDPDLIGILFHINIDPAAIEPHIFASLENESCFKQENEFLFTMHTVFRIGEIKQLEDRLWQVELSLTREDDNDLRTLTEQIREVTYGSTGWNRLGKLFLKIGKLDKAEEIFKILIKNSSEDNLDELAHYYHLMGTIKENQNNYIEALDFYLKTVKIYQSVSNSHHFDSATLYNKIGSIYQRNKEYSKALEFHQMAKDVQEKSKPPNITELGITYGNLAVVYKNLGSGIEALHYYEEELKIHKKSVPFKYIDLAMTYENIAEMYYNMKEYLKALNLFRKVSNIRQYCLRHDNTELAISYNNIGKVHEKMGNDLIAITQCQLARDILRKSIPMNYSELAKICNRIAELYRKIEQPSKALEFYEETLRNLDRSSHFNEINLAATHDNIGQMYEKIDRFKEAFLSYRKAIQMEKQSMISNESHLQLYQKHFHDVGEKLKINLESYNHNHV
ncbi:unnamed protein product [Adineta steineri]|uniref:Uncharacterized protein n=1 Tax=Adineta steineri TaxID=433720 RepID=A0A819WMJ9_9BILA|nr:unnamed protein product [Adineta steineri]CAF4128596.1 unnamed protein product [Adineta steineri]